MLQCELCDYYRAAGGCGACALTGHCFETAPDLLAIDYPCRTVSYQQYLERRPQYIGKLSAVTLGRATRSAGRVLRLCRVQKVPA